MKKNKNILILLAMIVSIVFLGNITYAKEDNIILNKPLTDDVNHTFKYPELIIKDNVNPYSITLSVENGHFNTQNTGLNADLLTYFNYKGGTNTSNQYVGSLSTTEDYKLITFNLKTGVDINDTTTKQKVITSAQNFLRDTLFYNDTDKDAKFTLTFSELAMKLITPEYPQGLDVVAFQEPGSDKEHYYVKFTGTKTWEEAYNIAAGLKWNNLQGYLATITSESEHNFIYNSLGSIEGWIGAAAIENSGSITYNTKNIVWDPANDKLVGSYRYKSGVPEYDGYIEDYWYWVAGPEAGQKVFDGYTHFKMGSNSNEPNNSNGNEWCAEYGFGDGGTWNDYPTSTTSIKGYYVEFGGFPDDNMDTNPTTLTNTFKWKDYDFRNISSEINTTLKDTKLTGNETLEDIKEIIDEIVEKTGLNNITINIKNKKINNGIFSFDIEIIIGEEPNTETYILPYRRDLGIDNPKTGDKIYTYITLGSISLIGLCTSLMILKTKKIKLQ